jgi:hypothetical protein
MYGWRAVVTYIVASGLTEELLEVLDVGSLVSSEAAEEKPLMEPQLDTGGKPLDYQIVHQIPGRIRIKMPTVVADPHRREQLQKIPNQEQGIHQIKLNPTTDSVLVTYSPELFSTAGEVIQLIQSYLTPEINSENQSDLKPQPEEEDQDHEPVDSAREQGSPRNSENTPEENNGEPAESDIELSLEEKTASEETTEVNSKRDHAPETNIEMDREEEVDPEAEIAPAVAAIKTATTTQPIDPVPDNPWSRFKSCALNTMLKLMVNIPVQPSR